jgi:hypothetical protein
MVGFSPDFFNSIGRFKKNIMKDRIFARACSENNTPLVEQVGKHALELGIHRIVTATENIEAVPTCICKAEKPAGIYEAMVPAGRKKCTETRCIHVIAPRVFPHAGTPIW